MGQIEFEWCQEGFLLDLSPVAGLLARFPRALEAAALDAIFALCSRSLEECHHIDPGTGRLTASREAQFLITSLRRSDSLTVYNIQIDWLGTRPEVEAYVLFRGGNTILRKDPRPHSDAPISQHNCFEKIRSNRLRPILGLRLGFARHSLERDRATPAVHLLRSSAKPGALAVAATALLRPPAGARPHTADATMFELGGLTVRTDRELSRLAWAVATILDPGAAARRHRAPAYCYDFAAEAECRMEQALGLEPARYAPFEGIQL